MLVAVEEDRWLVDSWSVFVAAPVPAAEEKRYSVGKRPAFAALVEKQRR